MWLKICGMTSPASVDAALTLGVDAIGFVFASSVRQLTPARAAQLASAARGRLACVAVCLHPTQAEIEQIVQQFAPDLLQTDLDDFANLTLPATLERLPVLRAGSPLRPPWPARLLFEGPRSGTGQTADWTQAATLAAQTSLILAGGLTADNVAAAIRAVRPAGVDTSSGVESAPGIKSAELMAEFVSAARAAFVEYSK
jgi:phosphoribosylanthranilate isomerase